MKEAEYLKMHAFQLDLIWIHSSQLPTVLYFSSIGDSSDVPKGF